MAKKVAIGFEKLFELAKRLDFFKSMKEHQIITVLKQLNGDVYTYKEDEIIIEEASESDELFIILSGTVTVKKGAHEFTAVGAVKSGDFFGEISFIMGSKRMATVVASEETIVLRLSKMRYELLDSTVQMIIKDRILQKLVIRLDTMNRMVLKLRNTKEV